MMQELLNCQSIKLPVFLSIYYNRICRVFKCIWYHQWLCW